MIKTMITGLKASAAALLLLGLIACEKKPDPTPEPPQPSDLTALQLFGNGKNIGDGQKEYEIRPGKYILKKGTYNLVGWVYITNGAELTIEPGTVIRGDKDSKATLIVEPGGKLWAKGKRDLPIVFTSAAAKGQRKPGDWGGLVFCGKARNNQGSAIIEGGLRTVHGGQDDEDNSGALSFVRIEFAGYPFKKDQEINGLTLGSVGRGTQIDHVQVSYCNDDSFEWFGGTVNCSNLIAYHGWDDDFDTDFGYSGHVQFALGVRHPRIADASWSNGFESDNDGKGSSKTPFTAATFSNVTLIGPMALASDFANKSDYINGGGLNPGNGSNLGAFFSAMQLRRNTQLALFNSVLVGYPVGIVIENDKSSTTQTWATEGKLKIQNVLMAGMTIAGTDMNKKEVEGFCNDGTNFDPSKPSFSTTYFRAQPGNRTLGSIAELGFVQPNSLQAGASWMPRAGSVLLSGASFVDTRLGGFKSVDYIGAFGSDDWTRGWANFDPQHADY